MKKDYDHMRKTIDEIKGKVDIVDFVNSYLSLTKKGKNYSALCPFHSEDTPSFYVFPDTQTFHCFGCGTHGDVITFLEKYEQISFLDALKKIASIVGVKVDLSENEIPAEIKLNEEVSKIYTNNLLNFPDYHPVWQYLKKRNINRNVAEEFELGYALGSEVNKVIEEHYFEKDIAIKAGLIVNDKDFFYNRLIIPIRNNSGLLVGFSGRLVIDSSNAPKYLNTPENQYFKKSKILYMYYKTKRFIKENDFAIIVEGYFDLISMYKLGFKNIVAILGSSFTKDQAVDLLKSTNKIVTMFDMDDAGKKATISTIDTLYKTDFQIAVSKYPAKDPDELTKKHDKQYIAEILKNSYKFHEFVVDYYAEKYELTNDFALEQYLKDMSKWYTKLEKAGRLSYIESFVECISKKIGKDKQYVKKILEANRSYIDDAPVSENLSTTVDPFYVEKDIKYDIAKSYIYLWVKYPDYRVLLKETFNIDDFSEGIIREFIELSSENDSIGFLLENSSKELSDLIVEVWKIDYYFNPDRILASLKDGINYIKINREIEKLTKQLRDIEDPSEKTKITSQIIELYSKVKTIK